MTSFPKNLFIVTSFIFVSCGQEKKEPVKEKGEIRYDKQKQLDTLNENEATNLSKQLDAITGIDSTIKFTYQIQKIVKKSNNPISFTGIINDITQKDSNYVLKVYGIFAKHSCFGEILVSPEQFQGLNNQLDLKSSNNRGCFIFKLISIKSSSRLIVGSEVLTDEDAETVVDANANASSELTYDFNDVLLFFKGNLVDFYLYKKLPKDDD